MCTQLRELKIAEDDAARGVVIYAGHRWLRRLRKLKLRGHGVSVQTEDLFDGCTQLEELTLHAVDIDWRNLDLSPLQALTRLRTTDRKLPDEESDGHAAFMRHDHAAFILRSCCSLAFLAGCTQIVDLNLRGCDKLSSIEPLRALSQPLHKLNLRDCIALSSLQPLSSLNQLQSLNISGCMSVSSLEPLSALNQLQVLDIGGLLDVERMEWRYDKSALSVEPLARPHAA